MNTHDGPDLLAVGVNPAIDLYYCLDRLQTGGVNRVNSVRRSAGGKANNLARAYRALGGNPITTGIVGGDTGFRILDGLSADGIAHDYICADGESRQTVTVVDSAETTSLLEPGATVTASALGALAVKVTAWSRNVPSVAFAGSLPPGAPAEYIARLVETVRAASGALVAVDVSGEALQLAAMAGPHLLKINANEFEDAFQEPVQSHARVERRYTALAEAGVETLCITDGARGALVISGEDQFVVRTASAQSVSTAGAGDAFLAGYLWALRNGESTQTAARYASAAGAAALQAVEAGSVDCAAVDSALERTELLDAAAFFDEVRA